MEDYCAEGAALLDKVEGRRIRLVRVRALTPDEIAASAVSAAD